MRKSIPLWAVIIIAFISLAVGAVAISIADDAPMGNPANVQSETEQLSEADAKKIALDKAGLTEDEVTFQRSEKDYENGILVYEIEFRQGVTEYKAEISVSDGKIISWEVDMD